MLEDVAITWDTQKVGKWRNPRRYIGSRRYSAVNNVSKLLRVLTRVLQLPIFQVIFIKCVVYPQKISIDSYTGLPVDLQIYFANNNKDSITQRRNIYNP